jgi:hypothetical protein
MNRINSTFILFSLLFTNILCGITVYPEHYVPSDSPYSFSSFYLSKDIKERQIYKLSYFSTSNSSPKIVSYKHGFIYTPDSSCNGYKEKSSSNFFLDMINKLNTRDMNNFSEELELLENICYGNNLIFDSPFPTLHNTGYILRYKLLVGADLDSLIILSISIGTNNPEQICSFNMEKKTYWLKMSIYSTLSQTNKITMNFYCDEQEKGKAFDVETEVSFKFILSSDTTSNIYLSFYQIILEDSTNSYLSSISDNRIIRTYNGLEQCIEGSFEKDCLLGYKCDASGSEQPKCKSCHFTCDKCNIPERNNGCSGCSRLTEPDNTIDKTTCDINFIDITNFKDIDFEVKVIGNEFHERSTMGLWIFISDLVKARSGNYNIFHIVLKDRYVLSIIPNEISVSIYFHAYEDLYRKITSETTLESNYADRSSEYVLYRKMPSDEQLKYVNSKDLSGQWFHVSCGLSFDHKKFFVSTMVNGEASTIELALKHESLYYDSAKNEYIENDIYNRHILNDKDFLNVEFRNFGSAGTKIFLKYFLLFQEYIPPEYRFMYYDYREYYDNVILFQVPFDELIVNQASNSYKIKIIDMSGERQIELKSVTNRDVNLTVSNNFKPFVLPKHNYIYNNINCKKNEIHQLVFSGTDVNWDDNKILFCDQGYLDTFNNVCHKGGSNCLINENKYIRFPGKHNVDKGYCDYLCSGPMTSCKHQYNENDFCDRTNENIYNMYYSCENKATKYFLQYSSFYNPGSIGIPVNPHLTSYLIEIWYYPDFFLSDTNRQGKYYYPETQKNYVFWSNVVQAYFLHSEHKTLKVEDAYSTHTTPHFHPYEWNKLVFHGLYKTPRYYKFFYINNLINDPIEFKHIREATDATLSSINFFSNGYHDGEYNQWAAGYYRGLRIWRGDQANAPLTIQYDNYFTNNENRVNSILSYFPLESNYIQNNKIRENIKNYWVPVSTEGSEDKLRLINFSSKFDFIRSQYPSLGYYLLADATAPKASQCGKGCLRCWNAGSNCYECSQGYLLTLDRACIPITKYYFKSPPVVSSTPYNAELKIEESVYKFGVTNPITVTFWIKVIGFKSDPNGINIIDYSDNDHLIFSEYDIDITKRKGLSLISGSTLVANDPHFRERIGYWTFIALSYYKVITRTEYPGYFPEMINFEVNGEHIQIKNYPIQLKFDKFTVYNHLFALVFNVIYYHEYIIGAYGFATNNGNLITPFAIPMKYYSYLVPGDSESNCFDYRDFLNNNGADYGCAGDYDIFFDSFATSFNTYIEMEKGYAQPKDCEFKNDYDDSVSNCLNACKGIEKTSCSCLNRNYNSQMLIKTKVIDPDYGNNGDLIYCRALDYINFSKAKKIKINHVRTAKETKKFTLQFWIFFYNYNRESASNRGNFLGSTFVWEGHNKITVFRDDLQKKYYTNCETYTMDDTMITLYSDDVEIDQKKWNFISCSVNYEERLFYLNLNNDIDVNAESNLDGPRLYTYTINPSVPTDFLLNNDWTTLEITDNSELEDWGYLYYRQIHLWKYAYFNAEFLSRVDILTPQKFPYLLNSWDTYFKGYKDGNYHRNFIVKDICEVANDFNVTYTGPLGFNYIPDQDIKYIDLCSEDGEYYDLYLKKCLPFADLGLIDDFEFKEVPFSYSWAYSMAFWIFFEDSSTAGGGVHLKWERHLQVTVIKFTQLQGYCLPQGYYSDDISNSQFSEKLNRIPNYASTPLLRNDQSESGVWIWVLCSVSLYDEKFFIKGNGAIDEKPIKREELYFSDLTAADQPVRSAYPYHYFMSEVENGKPQTSKLVLEGIANEKRIYIRDLFLFKDFIPVWYAEEFKNVDLSQLPADKMIQSMVFICNFADFNLNKMTLTYYVINQEKAGKESKFTKTKKTVKLTRNSKVSASKTFELCSNFAFIKIINPVEGDLCKSSDIPGGGDTDPYLLFYYCNDNKVPIVCRELKYMTLLADNSLKCQDTCEGLIRVPGTPSYSGICTIGHVEHSKPSYGAVLLLDYSNGTYTCNDNYYQIGYVCYPKTSDENSGFFFSRCYNQPNFYGVISNEIKEKIPNGYFYEFWFKLDKVQILEHCDTTAKEEYILYSTPHSIYLDLTENKYYYKIIDSIYSKPLDGINDYEWNKIVIKTTLGVTLGQNVYVYINFDLDNIKATFLNIPSSIKMQLQYISFCSKYDNGDCTPGGAAEVTWGSAYYRNIRVWELFSSSINSIQDFNIDIYTEWPFSLKLFYPLTISKMNYNKLSQVVGTKGIDSVIAQHEESDDFNSLDKFTFYNYETDFDWGVESPENSGRFISSMDGIYITSQECSPNCKRCYTNANTNCYQCNPGYVLKGMTCVYTEGRFYLKIPGTLKKPIQFALNGKEGKPITEYPGITLHFYMKFEGVMPELTTTSPHILSFKTNTFMSYNTITAYLEFDIESSTAFRYKTFYDILGIWIPYSIAIYVGMDPIPKRYPHMFTFSVNKKDIPFESDFTLPTTLSRINFIELGSEVIALFADLRVYNAFIQGSFGHAISSEKDDQNLLYYLILQYNLYAADNTNCLTTEMVSGSFAGSYECKQDYIDYMSKSCGTDITKYFDLSIPGESPCASCPEYCKTKCFNPNENQCTCSMIHGLYWLRRDKRTRETYCQYLPSIDYSILNDITINVPVSQSFESTIEFWLFIYSYNTETYQFKSITLTWFLHNKVVIFNDKNTIKVNCYAFDDQGEYLTLAITGYTWLYIRCGTDYISYTKKYFLNNQEEELLTQIYPVRDGIEVTQFEIKSGTPGSFGFVFLKEIKLWQQYNFKYINTQYINLVDDVGLYQLSLNRSTGLYPGLITYIKSDFNQEQYEEVRNYPYKYKIVNLVGKDDLGYQYPRTYEDQFTRNIDEFLGYNIVDPDNYGYYEDLLICNEGYVFNSENQVCLEVTLTKCRYPGDVSDNCVSCPDENKYIYPPNGNCVDDCGPRFYKRDDMNQCRDCHWTCYTCWSYAIDNCLSCIDDRYLVEPLHICVLYCQDYGLVASKFTPNLCVDFDVVVRLVNYQEGVPIDINTFDYLIAEITDINTKPYYTKWSFNAEKTRLNNTGRTLKFEDGEVPFEPNTDENLENLNVTFNHSFFELRTNYVFTLEITSYNILNNTKKAVRYFDFVLTMNSYPVDGGLEIIPTVGLHNTTIFLMRCQNWTDDTIVVESDLTYYFYAIEDLSNEVLLLQDWSPNNEIISSFALEKDALPSNNISIYCKIRDNYLAETEVVRSIQLVTDLNNGLYSLEAALNEYYLPDRQLAPVELYHLSEVLKSFGWDLFKPLRPLHYQTIYTPSIDKDMVIKVDPDCVTFDKECNNRGECNNKVDEFLTCRCEGGFIGKNCHIDKNDGAKLLEAYKVLYTKLLGTMQSEITYYEFKVMHNLFNGAQYFALDPSFYSNQMETFINMALNVYPTSIDNNTYEYIDLLDFYYSYELYRLNTKRVTKMYNTGLPYRDLPIDEEDKPEFQQAFEYIHSELISIIHYKCNMHINTQISYTYSSDNFYIEIKSVNPTFDEDEFFEERKNKYRSFPRFMTCLNYIENTRLNNPYFQTFMIYIEYLSFPFGYDEKISENNTSPLIELRFLDATTGKIFDLTECNGPNQINIDMPFTSYRWLDQINKQRHLYDPRNYKAPDDPIFSDPIYINKSGYVSDDTVEQRIKKYHREYNFSCRYYDIEDFKFVDTGVVFTNYTSDTNFIQFNTTHLTRFTTFFVLNNATFKVKGRFFYVPRTELMKWKGNYKGNFGLIVFIILICVYIIFSFVLGCYDSIYFVQETLLESLKKEIVKVFLPYRDRKEKEEEAKRIIPMGLDPSLIQEKKFGDKLKENNRYGQKKEDDDENNKEVAKETMGFNFKSNRTMLNSEERVMIGTKKVDKSKEFLNRKKNKDVRPENVMTAGNKMDLNLDLEIQNFYRTNIGKNEIALLNPNRLPEIFENKEVEYKRRLNGYANLGLSFCQYFRKNFMARNIFLSPFFNISMFGPRWKKLIVFTTEIASELLMLAVFLTNDENAVESNMLLLFQYSLYTVLIVDTFMHFMTIFFQVSNRQKRRLLKLVLMSGQLIVLKEYEDMQCVNAFIASIGMVICYAIWAFSFYMSFTFYSVWKVQNKAFIYSFIITIGLDFLVLEFLYELFLAIIYTQRKSSALFRRLGELLNRIRNHRCMS